MPARGYSAFGKLGRELAENLDVLIGVEQAEQDESARSFALGRITRPDGSCYELKVTLVKEGTTSDDEAQASLSKEQRVAVDEAKSKRKRVKRS